MIGEIERITHLSFFGGKLNAVLFLKTDFIHTGNQAQSIKRIPAKRHKAFANVIPWKLLLFQYKNAVTTFCEQRCSSTSSRTSADYNNIPRIFKHQSKSF